MYHWDECLTNESPGKQKRERESNQQFLFSWFPSYYIRFARTYTEKYFIEIYLFGWSKANVFVARSRWAFVVLRESKAKQKIMLKNKKTTKTNDKRSRTTTTTLITFWTERFLQPFASHISSWIRIKSRNKSAVRISLLLLLWLLLFHVSFISIAVSYNIAHST